jgi:hypothetical protein
MNWQLFMPVVQAQLAWAAGVPVIVENQSRHFAPAARLRLSVASSGSIGWDDNRNEVDSQGRIIQVRVGQRRFELHAVVESESQDWAHCAAFYIERMRTRMYFDSVTDALDAVKVALTGDTPLSNLDAATDGRIKSIAGIVIRFTHADVQRDTEHPQTTITSVGIGSGPKGPNGDLDVPPRTVSAT